jgi:hypothetical protein
LSGFETPGQVRVGETRILPEEDRTSFAKLFEDGPVTSPTRVVRRPEARFERYHPTERFPTLYRQLAKIKNARDVLYFVQRFGPMTTHGMRENGYDNVDMVIRNAAAMRSFTLAQSQGRDEFFSKIESIEKFDRLDFGLSIDEISGKPKLVFVPQSFLGAMWLQLRQALRGTETTFRLCDYCGELFETGPSAGRQLSL